VRESLRRLGHRVGFWLGLAGHVSIVYTFLFGGAAALVLTTLVVYVASFLDFVLGIPLFFRILFYASVFFLCFALVNHGRQRWRGWLAGRHEPIDVSPETEAKKQWRTEDALDRYLDQMQQWILDEQRPLASLPYDDPQRKVARTRTLWIVKRLDPTGKRDVLRFLYEHRLISSESPTIRLGGADFSGADLSRLQIWEANLDGINLSGADLTHISMSAGHGHSASMQEAVKRGSVNVFQDSTIPDRSTSIMSANLSGAVLRRASLGGCNLLSANFDGTDLREADLRGADLQLAKISPKSKLKALLDIPVGNCTCQIPSYRITLRRRRLGKTS
jgi:hypothetical protein